MNALYLDTDYDFRWFNRIHTSVEIMDLSALSIIELKAMAYDQFVALEALQQQYQPALNELQGRLQKINEEIQRINQTKPGL